MGGKVGGREMGVIAGEHGTGVREAWEEVVVLLLLWWWCTGVLARIAFTDGGVGGKGGGEGVWGPCCGVGGVKGWHGGL